MGYHLKALFGKSKDLERIADKFRNAVKIDLHEKISMIPMTGNLYNEINKYKINNEIDDFEFLTSEVEKEILEVTKGAMIAYVEVEFFGGIGGQTGIIWKDGHIYSKTNSLNNILKEFEIINEGFKDEFESIGLDRHRDTEDWLEE